jgi:hypothetical protein
MYGGSNLEGYIIVWGITIIQVADSGASALVALVEKLRNLCTGKITPESVP